MGKDIKLHRDGIYTETKRRRREDDKERGLYAEVNGDIHGIGKHRGKGMGGILGEGTNMESGIHGRGEMETHEEGDTCGHREGRVHTDTRQ